MVAKRIDEQIARIGSLKKYESQHVYIKDKLSGLVPYLNKKRVGYKEVLDQMEGVSPNGLILTEIKLNQEGEMEITGEAANVTVLSRFIKELLVTGSEEFVTDAALSTGTREEDGIYTFTIQLNAET